MTISFRVPIETRWESQGRQLKHCQNEALVLEKLAGTAEPVTFELSCENRLVIGLVSGTLEAR